MKSLLLSALLLSTPITAAYSAEESAPPSETLASPPSRLKMKDRELSAGDKAWRKFGNRLAKEHGMDCIGDFDPCAYGRKDTFVYYLRFVDYRATTLEEGRALATTLMHKMYQKSLDDPKILNVGRYKTSHLHVPEYFSMDSIALEIGFWDEEVNRRLEPYLARIKVIKGVINYYYADPKTQALIQPPIQEPLAKLIQSDE